jgi:hypothetical protein
MRTSSRRVAAEVKNAVSRFPRRASAAACSSARPASVLSPKFVYKSERPIRGSGRRIWSTQRVSGVGLAKEHTRAEQEAACRIRCQVKHFRERYSRMHVVSGLDVALAQNVGGVHVCAWIPGLHPLNERNRVAGSAAKIVRQPRNWVASPSCGSCSIACRKYPAARTYSPLR